MINTKSTCFPNTIFLIRHSVNIAIYTFLSYFLGICIVTETHYRTPLAPSQNPFKRSCRSLNLCIFFIEDTFAVLVFYMYFFHSVRTVFSLQSFHFIPFLFLKSIICSILVVIPFLYFNLLVFMNVHVDVFVEVHVDDFVNVHGDVL